MTFAGTTVIALLYLAGPYGEGVGLPGEPRSTRVTPAAEAGVEAAEAIDEADDRPTGGLTLRQKRIFVLGLAAREKK